MRSRIPAEEHSTGTEVAAALPLSALLSQVLVAFTIEFDNEFERRMPHRTTNHPSAATSPHAPWLVSLVMWSNCMKFVGDQGVRVGDLERLARTKTNLNGMERWGYIVVEPDPADIRAKPPRSSWLIRATHAGSKAQEVWRPLFGVIEERWRERFGKKEIGQLCVALAELISQMDARLPECLPILEYGLFSRVSAHTQRAPAQHEEALDSGLPLPALLSRVLLALAIEFERDSELSLAISADVVRVLGEGETRVSDLPMLSGVSKEAIKVALGILQKRQLVEIKAGKSGGRGKAVRLTAKGRNSCRAYHRLLSDIEQRWKSRFGGDNIRRLRDSLERLVGDPTAQPSPLFRGLRPYPDGWRASVPKLSTLPHFPMVLHRGGFPDGS